jgi:hypothetical protein
VPGSSGSAGSASSAGAFGYPPYRSGPPGGSGPDAEDRGPWYTRPAPAAIAASTCVAVVALSIWGFVLRDGSLEDPQDPGKFDVDPPPDPGDTGIDGAQGDDVVVDGAPDGDGTENSSDGQGETDSDSAPAPSGLRSTDSFPRLSPSEQQEHLGTDGTPTNVEPIATSDEMDVLLEDRFAHSSIMGWTVDDGTTEGAEIRAQFVGPTDWDATDEVMDAASDNPPPPEGYVYVTQRISVSMENAPEGDELGTWQSILAYWVTDDGEVYAATASLAPDDLYSQPNVTNDQSVEGNLIFCLPEDALDNGYWAISLFHSSNAYLLTPQR